MTSEEYEQYAIENGLVVWSKEMSERAIKALEQEPSGDLISKTEVRKFVEYIQSIKDEHNDKGSPINYGTICDLVIRGWKLLGDIKESLPSVNPQEQKTGHWIDHQEDRWIYAKCSECGTVHDTRTNYCPNCGAKMVEQKESEDKESAQITAEYNAKAESFYKFFKFVDSI